MSGDQDGTTADHAWAAATNLEKQVMKLKTSIEELKDEIEGLKWRVAQIENR